MRTHGARRENKDGKEAAYGGADHREAARSRTGPGEGPAAGRCSAEARDLGAGVLPLAEGVWRAPGRVGEASERAREGELAVEAVGGGPGAGQRDPEVSRVGKLLSPARRRQAVTQVQQRLRVAELWACRVLGRS